MAKILIVDDHAVVRRGIRQILEQYPTFQVSGEASSGEESLRFVSSLPCDLVILDLSLPDQSGWVVLREIKRLRPQLPVLLLTVHPEDQYATYAIKLRASGYLEKFKSPDDLLDAARIILGGGVYYSGAVLASLPNRSSHSAHVAGLSNREFAVLLAIAQGLSLSEVALKLKLSAKTVSTYRARVLRKLKLRTTAELVHYAVTHDVTRFS